MKDYQLERPESKVICNGCDRFLRIPDPTPSANSRQEVIISVIFYYISIIYTKIFSVLAGAGSVLRHDDD